MDLSLAFRSAHHFSDNRPHEISPSESFLELDPGFMTAIEVFDKFFVGPLATEGPLNFDSRLFANPKVVHDALSTPLETESLLDPDDNSEELLSILHDEVLPAHASDVGHDHPLDRGARIQPLSEESLGDFPAHRSLDKRGFIGAAPVQSGLHGESYLILDE